MSRNGSGSYSLPVNSWNPAINSVPATASDWQALINDVAQALTQSLSRDGQTVLTGNLQMGGNKLTGMSAGAASGESLRFEQLFSQGQPQDLASAATTDIGAQLTTVLNITGTTTITSFGSNYNGPRFLRFADALTLTHSASLVLPGGANITTAAGDSAIVVPLGTPAAGWRVIVYFPSSGYVSKAGDTMSGPLVLNADPAAALGAATKQYVDGAAAAVTINQVQPIAASVAGSALTLTLNATKLDFRSATLGSGTVNKRTVASPISLTISSGSTLGTVNAVASRIAVLAIDNAGTVELAAVNLAGGNNLDETTLISTTAEGGAGAADSANVIYSQTARTSVPFRVVGYVESTQATTGTWATAPSTIQGAGGQALAALQSLGFGQTWQNVAASRAFSTTYYNTTGRPIVVAIQANGGGTLSITVNGVVAGYQTITAGNPAATVIVPPGGSYSATGPGSGQTWAELR